MVSNVPVKSLLPTLITASIGLVSTTFGSPTILEFTIVQVVILSPTLPLVTSLYSPAFNSESYSTVYLNGISSLYSWVPSVLDPTFITLFSGSILPISFSLVVFRSPFSKVWVISFVTSPSFPSLSTFLVPASRVSSKTISVSKGSSSFTSYLYSPL